MLYCCFLSFLFGATADAATVELPTLSTPRGTHKFRQIRQDDGRVLLFPVITEAELKKEGAPDVNRRIQKIKETITAVVKTQVSNQNALTVLDEKSLNPADLRASMTNAERAFRDNLSQLLSATNLYLSQLRSELDQLRNEFLNLSQFVKP